MNKQEKAITKAKKTECVIGIFFLIPPILGVFFFLINLCDVRGDFVDMTNLSGQWDWHSGDSGASMSPAPVYLGLMAIAGAYLIKDSLAAFFMSDKETKPSNVEANTEA